jgi:serine phosphatase RsbU (regulator of sigma subunit)
VPDDAMLAACEDLGVLAGYLIAMQARVTDLYGLHRRRKAMSLAASMQWDLLPPLTLTSRLVTAAGMLEPAYDVGGDCFDYALNGKQLDMAFMDSMGHGLRSAMMSALAVGCYRHDRREGRTLEHIHQSLDAVIAQECGDEAFVTGHLGRLDLSTGIFTWINAGHPPPMLVRNGRVVASVDSTPSLPWGLGTGSDGAEIITTALEPGDSVLFYTDGVVETRGGHDEEFGVDRLADLVGQHASNQLPVSLIVRTVVQAVLEHHQGKLTDDATVLMINWPGLLGD